MLFHNLEYRLWKRIDAWWKSQEPNCRHWFRVVSPSGTGRIEVSKCVWCDILTSDLWVSGRPFDVYERDAGIGYGPREMHPMTDDPDPTYRPFLQGHSVKVPSGEFVYRDGL